MNAAERKIHSALKTAATAIREDALEPTAALAKSARAHDLNPEMTRRTAEMLNVALTHAHFRSGDDKTASFPLADTDAAIRDVFTSGPIRSPDNLSDKSTTKSAVGLTADERFRARLQGGAGFTFEALASPPIKIASAGRRGDPSIIAAGTALKRVQGFLGHEKCAAEAKRAGARSAADRMAGSLKELVNWFDRRDEQGKYAAFESQAYGEYGDAIEPYLEFVRGQLPNIVARGDVAFSKGAQRWDHVSVPNKMFDRFVEDVGVYRAAQSSFDVAVADLGEKTAALDQTLRILSPTASAITAAEPGAFDGLIDFGGIGKSAESAESNKEAGFGDTLKQMRSLVGIPDHTEIAMKGLEANAGDRYARGHKAHEHQIHKAPQEAADHELLNVKREAIMRDLLTNDEIISKHDPAHIESAYNGILSTAPELTLNRELLRSVLRNSTAQQAIDPFMGKQLADLSNVTLKNQNLRSGKLENGAVQ